MEHHPLTHLDSQNRPRMVNVGGKTPSLRTASARSVITIDQNLSDLLLKSFANGELNSPKGPVFQTAIIAGTLAAKKCGELIPFCHPVGLDACEIQIDFVDSNKIQVVSSCSVFAKTGIEMEALTACSVAALTIYDMCKAFGKPMVISETRLLSKTGGKKDYLYGEQSSQ